MTADVHAPKGAAIGQRIGFCANDSSGQWRIETIVDVIGLTLENARYLQVGEASAASGAAWTLNAFVSNLRYTTQAERSALQMRQAALGQSDNRYAVLIPIRKTAAWWALAQDERLEIYTRSKHTQIGLDYVLEIARQLHHCRDLGEPFDFLTWFEFAANEADRFRALLAKLRSTEEWTYVDREVELWLTRSEPV